MTNDFRVTVSGKVKTIFNLSIFLGISPIRGFPIPQSSRGTNDILQATKEMLKLSFISNISFFDPKTFKDKSDFFSVVCLVCLAKKLWPPPVRPFEPDAAPM